MRSLVGGIAACAFNLAWLACTGCSSAPGYPKQGTEMLRPENQLDFHALFKENCAGCHGENGRGGPSLPLNNPAFLAVAGEGNLEMIVGGGESGTLMPAFAKEFGGMLTDEQVDAIVQGMLRQWAHPAEFAKVALPPFDQAPGNAANGQKAYAEACARCHGGDGTGVKQAKPQAGATPFSIVDPTYLSLISDQSLRSIVIAGHPQASQPDWRSYIPGHALTSQEIGDVVAWLGQYRPPANGQSPGRASPATPRVAQPLRPGMENR